MSEPEGDEDREEFAAALASWGLTPSQIAETLEATEFGFGLVELKPQRGDPARGVAIVVNDRRDHELRELFEWREQTSDADFAAEWEVDEAPAVRVVLGPDGQALARFAINLRRPKQLERRYLFAVTPVAALLAGLQNPGTGIWLAAATAIEKEAAREGPVDAYDLMGRSLRAGVVVRALPGIDEALAHVGAPRQTPEASPMNRAERRAAARRDGREA